MRHQSSEIRNFLCGHIKRNDPASRRFIQYLAMETSKVVVLVRDGKTGKIILKPPTEQNWLARYKEGVGRASKREFITTQSVGEKFFEEMDRLRKWSLSFNEYYDVYVWDFEPGQPFWNIESTVMKVCHQTSSLLGGLMVCRCFLGRIVLHTRKTFIAL